MLPPTRLIATLEAPPPKNLVTTRVAKFGAKADGNSQITNRMYDMKYLLGSKSLSLTLTMVAIPTLAFARCARSMAQTATGIKLLPYPKKWLPSTGSEMAYSGR